MFEPQFLAKGNGLCIQQPRSRPEHECGLIRWNLSILGSQQKQLGPLIDRSLKLWVEGEGMQSRSVLRVKVRLCRGLTSKGRVPLEPFCGSFGASSATQGLRCTSVLSWPLTWHLSPPGVKTLEKLAPLRRPDRVADPLRPHRRRDCKLPTVQDAHHEVWLLQDNWSLIHWVCFELWQHLANETRPGLPVLSRARFWYQIWTCFALFCSKLRASV